MMRYLNTDVINFLVTLISQFIRISVIQSCKSTAMMEMTKLYSHKVTIQITV